MDARVFRLLLIPAALLAVAAAPANQAYSYRTRNFVVTAPTAEAAKQVGDAAEVYRKEIAVEWLGKELPPWYAPCPVKVKVGQIGAGGQTTFSFHPSQNGPDDVCGWDMQIQGSLERILDSVLPHEISHTIFACYFRRPLPRWADEGAATLIEHESERKRQIMTVRQVITTSRRIPLKTLFSLKEYPRDMRDVMTLYAEGYSLAELLVQQGGKARYLKFLNDAHQRGWETAVQTHYDYQSVDELEKKWHEWIIAGSPPLPDGQLLARAADSKSGGIEIRGQSPDVEPAREMMPDPFLASDTLMADASPRTRNGQRKPRLRLSPSSKTQASKIERDPSEIDDQANNANRDWTPSEDESVASLALREDDSAREDGVWLDAPRQSNGDTVPRPDQSPSAVRQNLREVAPSPMTVPARGPLPSAAAPRQSTSVTLPVSREDSPPRRRQRTPWSEFPQEGRPRLLERSVGVGD